MSHPDRTGPEDDYIGGRSVLARHCVKSFTHLELGETAMIFLMRQTISYLDIWDTVDGGEKRYPLANDK